MQRIYFPHSLGLLYLAIAQYLGFLEYGDEYKVMGLAAYGTPDFDKSLQQLVNLKQGGDFTLELTFFCHWSSGDNMTWNNGQPTIGRVYSPKLESFLLNPSFNVQEPIVHKPSEALDCFLRTDIDVLVLGHYALTETRSASAKQE